MVIVLIPFFVFVGCSTNDRPKNDNSTESETTTTNLTIENYTKYLNVYSRTEQTNSFNEPTRTYFEIDGALECMRFRNAKITYETTNGFTFPQSKVSHEINLNIVGVANFLGYQVQITAITGTIEMPYYNLQTAQKTNLTLGNYEYYLSVVNDAVYTGATFNPHTYYKYCFGTVKNFLYVDVVIEYTSNNTTRTLILNYGGFGYTASQYQITVTAISGYFIEV